MIDTSDFEFVQKIYSSGLAKRADEEGVRALSEPERNVLLAWWAKGEIDNGGFSLLYAGKADIDLIIEAFNKIGIKEAAQACKESKAIFHNSQPPINYEDRLALIDELTSDNNDPWEKQNIVIWDLDKSFDKQVADYLRNHYSSFMSYLMKD